MRHARTVGALWVRAEMSPHRLFRLFDVRSAAPASARQDIAGERLARLSADEAVEWEKAIVPPAVQRTEPTALL